jgi:hypothetical protein
MLLRMLQEPAYLQIVPAAAGVRLQARSQAMLAAQPSLQQRR